MKHKLITAAVRAAVLEPVAVSHLNRARGQLPLLPRHQAVVVQDWAKARDRAESGKVDTANTRIQPGLSMKIDATIAKHLGLKPGRREAP